jgi:hypothetical protein
MKPLLIGLAGRMESGKSTAASHLRTEHGFIEYSFADPLKDMVCTLLGITREKLEEMKRSELPVLPARADKNFPVMRTMLQTLGTEWGREQIHPELWLAIAEQRIAAATEWSENTAGIVISDVRFANEADLIRSKGGTVIHILRKDAAARSSHSSEKDLPIYINSDLVLKNDHTQQHLFDQLDFFVGRLREIATNNQRAS